MTRWSQARTSGGPAEELFRTVCAARALIGATARPACAVCDPGVTSAPPQLASVRRYSLPSRKPTPGKAFGILSGFPSDTRTYAGRILARIAPARDTGNRLHRQGSNMAMCSRAWDGTTLKLDINVLGTASCTVGRLNRTGAWVRGGGWL